MSIWNRVRVACAALALAATAAACSGTPAPAPTPVPGSPASALVAVRWWSTTAAQAGSTIDPKDPEALAGKLHTSQTQYCDMLRQTISAGRSILPNVTANDPALLASTRAFVAELRAVAPPTAAGPWRVLGPAVLALVGSGGDLAKVKGIDAAAVQEAARVVAADAKRSCGVDLSSGAA
ncbi:MAG TPA: hypothetical protein VKB75_14610 [Jatrophihabitans sp.]|nr:hypothetical protein [Jatrophihabitans sp.]